MSYRTLAAAALAGAALLAPAPQPASASGTVCDSGALNCPYVVLKAALDTYGEARDTVGARLAHLSDLKPLPITQRCWYVHSAPIDHLCVPPDARL
ncbi:MAG TPA: hypothetical protein VF519_12935 [Mycobacteriales bacterium]|jgi:hypothetical protein